MAGVLAAAGSTAVAGTALAFGGGIGFDGKPGTAAPPPKLHRLKMKKFKQDSRPDGSMVSYVKGPTGNLKFGAGLVKRTVPSSWNTWSNGYTGSVYYDSGQSLTLALPVGTKAFYVYIEPARGTGSFSAAAGQVSSHERSINSDAGAKYFGFYARRATVSVKLITVTETGSTGGFAIGEFGIHCARPRHMCSRSNRHKTLRRMG